MSLNFDEKRSGISFGPSIVKIYKKIYNKSKPEIRTFGDASPKGHSRCMASNFRIRQPYVLTSLPKPLDPTNGRYVVGEVFGHRPGTRKRKRPEISVGIDGEAVNIYHVRGLRTLLAFLLLMAIYLS
jgi:hypothetical protein